MSSPAKADESSARVVEKEISAAIKKEDWPRATSLCQEALLDPSLPLLLRALCEGSLATFPGREQHMRHHYDKCVEAIDAMQENADADPEKSKETYERIGDLREGLKLIEELMAMEQSQGDGKSAGQNAV